MTKSKNENAILSIGGLAKSSGLPVETLRNWERRYGFPKPERLESGHRRYSLNEVKHLRLIRNVIDSGYKPSFAVRASPEQLEKIIHEVMGPRGEEAETVAEESVEAELNRFFGHVESMDASGMEVALRRAWSKYGATRFITQLAVPFLREVGERWFKGQNTVAHEHFASETLQSFLASEWRPLTQRARGTKVVLANLEGELHCLGIHMAAVFLALNDIGVVFLGPNTPLEDVVTTASDPRVAAVVIGFSMSSELDLARKRIEQLRGDLRTEAIVIVGGNEFLPSIPGVLTIPDYEAFEEWAKGLRQSRFNM